MNEKYLLLSDCKFAKVNVFQGILYIHIREYFKKNKKLIAKRKGVSLTEKEWIVLCNNFEKIDLYVQDIKKNLNQ